MKTWVKNIHFMGIGGSGISGVAALAGKMGYSISGCDLEKASAYVKNITKGHDASHVAGVDLVVVSPAIFYQNAHHAEVLEAKKQNKLITWQEFVGNYLHNGKRVICVCGTHGKSTTTAMVGKLLEDAGLDPTVLVGAKVPQWSGNSRFGKGKYFVTEADEFFDNFLHYTPDIIILNNIEFDHPDFFKSKEAVFTSFQKFIDKLKGTKMLIVNDDDLGVRKLISKLNLNDVKLVKYRMAKSEVFNLHLKVFGRQNVQNALGVLALGKELKIPVTDIKMSLSGFTGITRRMELIYKRKGIKVYDDYAHHPTAILATLEGLREQFPKTRIWAIVEPHGYSRTKALLPAYAHVFDAADKVIVGPIFKARDKEDFGLSPQSIVNVSLHKSAISALSFAKISQLVNAEVKSGDIILVMGAGKSYLWAKNLLKN